MKRIVLFLPLIFFLFSLTACISHKQVSVDRLPILVYHLIGRPEGRWKRTPEKFRSDIEWLYQNGYYPFNLRDVLTGFKGLPKGKKPVVLTFDDSSSGQFRYLPNGKLDPDCAVGTLKSFHEKHPDWPMRATFFVLIETGEPDRNLFGQPEFAVGKLRQLTEWGMEVGSHTYSHDRFDWLTPDGIRRTLAKSYIKLKDLSGQEIISLSLPLGFYPSDNSLFSGEYKGIKYEYKLVAEVAGGLQVVPWDKGFDSFHIKRIQTIDSEWKRFFKRKF